MREWATLGAAVCFALGPLEGPWGPPAWLAGWVLWSAVPKGEPAKDLARGALVGLAWYASSLSWVWTTWTQFQSPGDPTLLWVGLSVLQAVVPALGSALAGCLLARGVGRPLALAIGWTTAEGLAPWIQPLPGGLSLYMSQIQPMLWPAAWGGVALWSAVAGWTGGLLVRRPLTGVVSGAIWLMIGLMPAPWAHDGRPIRVGMVQPNRGALAARSPSRFEDQASDLRAAIDGLGAADLVVTPEGAWPLDPGAPGSDRRKRFLASMASLPPLLLGASMGDPPTNSLIGVERGQVIGDMAKVFLLPVGERSVLGMGRDVFEPGVPGERVIDFAGLRVAGLICYEDLIGDARRDLGDASLVVVASNDTWLGPGAGSRAHEAGSRLAAVVTGRWIVRPTTAGRSMWIDPSGRIHGSWPWVDGDDPAAPAAFAEVVAVRARVPPFSGAQVEPTVFTLAALGWVVLLVRRRPAAGSRGR